MEYKRFGIFATVSKATSGEGWHWRYTIAQGAVTVHKAESGVPAVDEAMARLYGQEAAMQWIDKHLQ